MDSEVREQGNAEMAPTVMGCRQWGPEMPGRVMPLTDGQDPARVPLRELMDDRPLGTLLERSRDKAGRAATDRRGLDAGRAGQGDAGAELTARLDYESNERTDRGGT
jgi:hypothetical protein